MVTCLGLLSSDERAKMFLLKCGGWGWMCGHTASEVRYSFRTTETHLLVGYGINLVLTITIKSMKQNRT